MNRDLGRVGIWTGSLGGLPATRVRERAAELDELGYGVVWVPDAMSRDPFVAAMLVLEGGSRLVAATGVAGIHGRGPVAMRAAWESVTEAGEGRFVLGLGVSHAVLVEGVLGHEYRQPVATMREYLDAMDAAPYLAATGPSPRSRVLAALGPRMLDLARERADGALTYFVPVEHTSVARELLGGDAMLAVEQAVVLARDPDEARRVARLHMQIYLGLPNYANNLRRLGWLDDDLASAGSDRLVDALVAWGDETAIRERVDAHLRAGADHVCVQVLTDPQFRDCVEEWRELAPALLD